MIHRLHISSDPPSPSPTSTRCPPATLNRLQCDAVVSGRNHTCGYHCGDDGEQHRKVWWGSIFCPDVLRQLRPEHKIDKGRNYGRRQSVPPRAWKEGAQLAMMLYSALKYAIARNAGAAIAVESNGNIYSGKPYDGTRNPNVDFTSKKVSTLTDHFK